MNKIAHCNLNFWPTCHSRALLRRSEDNLASQRRVSGNSYKKFLDPRFHGDDKLYKKKFSRVLVAFLIAGLMITHSSHTFAQENRLTKEELESRLLSIKNPFESKLPKKEQKPEIVIKDPKPPILPVRNPELPKQIKHPPDPDPPRPKIQETIKKIVPKPEIPVPSVAITGIIWNSDRPQAIINGQIVDIGDTILGLEITDIQKSGIEAMFHGRSVTIKTQRSPL